MAPLFHATLNSRSPRYEDWRAVLESDEIPLASPQPFWVFLEGTGQCQCYLLALSMLSGPQIDRLIAFTAAKFGNSESEVRRAVGRVGYPVRAEDVVVAIDMRLFA